jgi:hypothetical protein
MAKHFISAAYDLVYETGGVTEWATQHRAVCFRFVRLFTDIASVFHEHEAAFKQLEVLKSLCVTSTEKITVQTILVRQLIAANEHMGALEQLLATMDEFGYNPENPTAVELWVPTCVNDVEALGEQMRNSPPAADDEDHVLILSLLNYSGPTIYITQPERRNAIFNLGLSIIKSLGRKHKSVSYLLATHCTTVSTEDVANTNSA